MDYSVKKLPKNVTEITALLKKETIAKEEKNTFEILRQDLQVEGFRKGKVPTAIAKKHIAAKRIVEKAAEKLISDLYGKIIKETGLRPIVQPKVTLLESKPKADWKIRFTIAEKPTIKLGDYKKRIKEAKKELNKADIWIPGKGNAKEKSSEAQAKAKREEKSLNIALETLLKTAKIEIADLVIEKELNRRLSSLIDDVRRMGLTIEKYAQSKNTTVETIKEKTKEQIVNTYKIEFLLAEIADKEKIVVSQKEIDNLFTKIKDEKEKKAAQANTYYYVSILRKQKTLDFLRNL